MTPRRWSSCFSIRNFFKAEVSDFQAAQIADMFRAAWSHFHFVICPGKEGGCLVVGLVVCEFMLEG